MTRGAVLNALGRTARGLLTLGLLAFGAIKLATPHSPAFLLPAALYYAVALAETVAAVLLWTRWRRRVCWGLVVLFATGWLASMAWPARPCGCLGWYVEGAGRAHALVAGLSGLLTCAVLWSLHPAPTRCAGSSA